jgi:hypothetical protein
MSHGKYFPEALDSFIFLFNLNKVDVVLKRAIGSLLSECVVFGTDTLITGSKVKVVRSDCIEFFPS